MRRTASEVLRDLEIRIARLEKQSNPYKERHDRRRADAIRATGKPKFNLNYHLIKAELKYNIQFDRSSLSQRELASWVAYNPKDIEDLFGHKAIMMAYHRSGSTLGEAPIAFYHLDDSMSDKEIRVKFHFLP